jgi:phosphatidylglycerophosphatase A
MSLVPEEKRVKVSVNLRDPAHFIAFGFGSGLAPQAPGTFGTLAAVPLYLLLVQLPWPAYLAAVLLVTLLGIWACGVSARKLGVHDHNGIVWDEVAGFLLTMAVVAPTLANVIAGFALFRFFDIVKPWPIRWLDRHVHGGLGIMADDLLAAVYAAICLLGLSRLLPGVFAGLPAFS